MTKDIETTITLEILCIGDSVTEIEETLYHEREPVMTDGIIVKTLRCALCKEVANPGQMIGVPCVRCEDSGTGAGRIVLVFECGSRFVEISTNAAGNFTAAGFIGDGRLSREFGVKNYSSEKNAIVAAQNWLDKHA